jgi:uncharacterized protein (DUF885 family)
MFAVGGSAGLTASARNVPADPARARAEDAKLLGLLDRAWQQQLARDPTLRTQLRLPGPHDSWTPITDARDREDEIRSRAELRRLPHSVDYSKLSPARRLDYQVYEEVLRNRIKSAAYHRQTYFFTRNTSDPYLAIPQLLISAHDIRTPQDARDYIAQMQGLPKILDDAIAGTQARARDGITLPAFNFADIVKNSRALIAGSPCDNRAASEGIPGGDDGSKDQSLWADFQTKLKAIDLPANERRDLLAAAKQTLQSSVCPAYRKLADTVLQLGKDVTRNDGLWSLPNGEQLYRDAIALHTSLAVDPTQLHQTGLKEVDRIETALREIMNRVGFHGSIQEFLAATRKLPRFQLPQTEQGRADYLARVQQLIDQTRERLPQLFTTMPQRPLIVRPVEPDREVYLGNQAFYQPPPGDSGPGVYYIGMADLSEGPLWDMEVVTYHEAIPGHHFQTSLAAEIPGLSQVRRHYENDAYQEGWALYAESLGSALGGYSDDYMLAARFKLELLRAVRVVVETGFHHEHWSWDHCAEYYAQHQGVALTAARTAVTRYMVWPGQGVSYTLGELEIERLRAMAAHELGPKFDVRAFHTVILDSGPLPFNLLEQLVDSWIRSVNSNESGAVPRIP